MLELLNLLPKWFWAALVVALSATSCKLKWDNGQLSIDIEKGKTYVAQLETNIAKSNEIAAAQATRFEQQARTAEQERNKREKVILADSTRAKSELERLRSVVASSGSIYRLTAKSDSSPIFDYSDTLGNLLLSCSTEYLNLAAKSDGHVNDLKTLMDAWPK
jgi:hypothetical protein